MNNQRSMMNNQCSMTINTSINTNYEDDGCVTPRICSTPRCSTPSDSEVIVPITINIEGYRRESPTYCEPLDSYRELTPEHHVIGQSSKPLIEMKAFQTYEDALMETMFGFESIPTNYIPIIQKYYIDSDEDNKFLALLRCYIMNMDEFNKRKDERRLYGRHY